MARTAAAGEGQRGTRTRRRTAGADVPGELMRAAWRGDEETFDRIFDAWFTVLYAEAWEQTRDHARAQALTRERVLDEILGAAESPIFRALGRAS